MAVPRELLNQLNRGELLQAIEQLGVEVRDRRVREQLVEGLAGHKGLNLEAILGEPAAGQRLKELCRALGLDDGGREKAGMLARLTGAPPAIASSTPKRNGSSKEGVVDVPTDGKLSREQLERYLWSAADILRGSIDSSDYKGFIFGMLFLKRLSDRFDEECEQLVKAGDDPNDRDNHQFFVPKRARWPALQSRSEGLGEALNTACVALEDENPASLGGVLAGIDYNDERKLGDARNRDGVLARLVQHFSKLNLRNDNLSEPDLLGRAYEYLIEKFADDAGKKGGEFYTPHMVVRLLVELLAPKEDAGLRPHMRVRWHARPVRRIPAPPWSQPEEHLAVRPGEEPGHLGHLQDEHAPAWFPRRAHREGRHAAGP